MSMFDDVGSKDDDIRRVYELFDKKSALESEILEHEVALMDLRNDMQSIQIELDDLKNRL